MMGWVGGGCVQPIVLREAKQVLQTGRPKLLTISPDEPRDDWNGVKSYRMTCEGGGSLEIYLEPFLPKPQLLIVGRSPVAQTISHLGRLLDFKVIIADPEARSESFPDADLVLTDLNVVRDHINDESFVVVATMGNGDEEGLLAVAGTRPKYLGLVASAKKSEALFEYARTKGATAEDIATFKCPAGVDLGGETLPEIALSVAAELVHVRRAGIEEVSTKNVAIDPICGMTVDTVNAKYTSVVNNETIYFCCLRCKETFDHPQVSQLTRIGK
jgi:xanthine dehydrogenase accessory factor